MSELQLDDDPDPQPSDRREYPMNWVTGLAFDDLNLVEDYIERERIFLESEAIARLSERADQIIGSELGEGDVSHRRIVTDRVELYRSITGSNKKVFTFIDTVEGSRRCRAWVDGDVGVSWCEDEQRYEPAAEVQARLEALFPITESGNESARSARLSTVRRVLATLALR